MCIYLLQGNCQIRPVTSPCDIALDGYTCAVIYCRPVSKKILAGLVKELGSVYYWVRLNFYFISGGHGEVYISFTSVELVSYPILYLLLATCTKE